MFYAVVNNETGEYLEHGGRGAIWANSVTIKSLMETRERADTKRCSLPEDEFKSAETVGIEVTVKRLT